MTPRRRWRPLRVALAVLLVLGVAALLAWQSVYFVQVLALRTRDPSTSAYMEAHVRATGRQPRRIWVDLAAVSPHMQRAVIAAEDARFFSHWGVDIVELADAMVRNYEAGHIVRGASTITMQLARNLFLSGEQRYGRKLQEMAIAYMLEAALTKRRILELYLNIAQWGTHVYGIEAAARHYYGVPASDLELDQATWLAAVLPAPAYYDRHRDTPWLLKRRIMIEREMRAVRVP